MHSVPKTFDWKEEGFKSQPVPTVASGQERLYRAWGQGSTKLGNPTRAGVCFSLDRAKSRWDAERLYSVMEWNNAVYSITEFSVPKGTPMWIGVVDPGDMRAALGSSFGRQVFIERGYLKGLKENSTARLSDDLGGNEFHPSSEKSS
jgi:hypothetical protein